MKIKKYPFYCLLTLSFIALQSLVHRHDIKDELLLELGKQYPQICHFREGEGTLFRSKWIITAAHLAELYVQQTDPEKLKVECNGQSYSIAKVFIHPDYISDENNVANDIALIQLKEPVKDVQPVELYKRNDEKDKEIVLVGRGYTGNGVKGTNRDKALWDKKTRAGTNRIDSVHKSAVFFRLDEPSHLRVTRLEAVSGPGDSGGPALFDVNGKKYIIGISSSQIVEIKVDASGNKTGGEGKYGVVEKYTRVSYFLDWIQQIINTNK